MGQDRVLVCDDDDTVRAVVVIALELVGGYRVTAVRSGAEAIQQFAQSGADIVVLDVWMPDLDGPATLAQLRALPGGAKVPIVFLSGKDDSAEIAQLRALDVADVLSKPFDIVQFSQRIQKILEMNRVGAPPSALRET